MVINFLLCVVLTEALTELLVKSEFFNWIRAFFFAYKEYKCLGFVSKLIECGYCTSVWFGFLTSALLMRGYPVLGNFLDWFIWGLVVHRAANIGHHMIDRINPNRM